MLLTTAGLLAQSLRNLDNQPYGFSRQGRLIVQIDPRGAGYAPARLTSLYRQIEDRLSTVPGVTSTSLSLYTAQQGNNWSGAAYIAGRSRLVVSSWDRVGARYFETIGTPIVRGRGIGEEDTPTSRKVAVINEAFARRYFPHQDPIGKHFGKFEPGHAGDYEIVGIASDAKYQSLARAADPMFFIPLAQTVVYGAASNNRVEQESLYMGSIELHVQGDPKALAPSIRRALADVDPNLPPTAIRTFEDLVQMQTSEHVLLAGLSNAFGLIALLLAAIGLYGVTACGVARRTNEIGLRMALGASRGQIGALVLRGAFARLGIGLAVGAPLALAAAFALRHQLFGVSPFSPAGLGLAAATLLIVSFVAALVPARRAATVDPMSALRQE